MTAVLPDSVTQLVTATGATAADAKFQYWGDGNQVTVLVTWIIPTHPVLSDDPSKFIPVYTQSPTANVLDNSSKYPVKKRKSPSTRRRDKARLLRWLETHNITSPVSDGTPSDTCVFDPPPGPFTAPVSDGTPTDNCVFAPGPFTASVSHGPSTDSADVPPSAASDSDGPPTVDSDCTRPSSVVVSDGFPADSDTCDIAGLFTADVSVGSPTDACEFSGPFTALMCDSPPVSAVGPGIPAGSDSSSDSDVSDIDQGDTIRPLSQSESLASLESWIAAVTDDFLTDDSFRPLVTCRWGRSSRRKPNRDLVDDDDTIEPRRTAADKNVALNAMLSQLSHLCERVIRVPFHRRVACLHDVWTELYIHFGLPVPHKKPTVPHTKPPVPHPELPASDTDST